MEHPNHGSAGSVGSPAAAAHDGTMDSITAVLGAPLHDQGATKADWSLAGQLNPVVLAAFTLAFRVSKTGSR